MSRLLALLMVSILGTGCSERSSLFITNETAHSVVVRVFYNDFAESFGFNVPVGARAWAWAPLEGRVAGPIAVYDSSCNVVWSQAIPSEGGQLTLRSAGDIVLMAPGLPSTAPSTTAFLDYTNACADSGNPGR